VIPHWSELQSAAQTVLRNIPAGLTNGRVQTGLYGVGFLGRWALPKLTESGLAIASCYDGNAALAGTKIGDIPIRAATDLKISKPEFMVVTARHAVKPVSEMLFGLGIPHASYDAWYAASELALFRRAHDAFADERSREVLRALLLAMLTGDATHCRAVAEKDQYFALPNFWGTDREIYVDAGAFAGDSVERFIWAHSGVFRKIYAFEPGPRQFAALKARTERLAREWALDAVSIEPVNSGLGDKNGAVQLGSDSGHMTSLSAGHGAGSVAKIVSLDNFLNGAPITFLKADVEGMEMTLLKGARETIQRCKPKVCICVYHYPPDLPEIATYLHELMPDYQFALRHHSPQLMETVLYAWTG